MPVSVTIPVYNEEARLPQCVGALAPFLDVELAGVEHEIVVADNGSTDSTVEVARGLQARFPQVRVEHLGAKGRGRALKQVWLASDADVLGYMDVDLSTDLPAFPALIEGLLAGRYDLAIGSRLLPISQTRRSWKRETISRGYNLLVRSVLHTHFSDAQCGFKALTRRAAQELLPQVEDTGWFFDTELLVLAEKLGYRILDLPVRWVENTDSRVCILRTALADIRGILRLRRRLSQGGLGERDHETHQRHEKWPAH